MMDYQKYKLELEGSGYAILPQLYSDKQITQILEYLERVDSDEKGLVKTKDLFAIRQLFRNVPGLAELVLTPIGKLISELAGADYFVSKAIYFDKPSESNWFVAYHQDLSISVDKKAVVAGYENWTFKKGQHGVQPPVDILKDTITIRVHLDDTDQSNGALKVIPGSHVHGVIRSDSSHWDLHHEKICVVKKGAVMLMKPLTLHASGRTTNGQRRRVIHLELNRNELMRPLQWLEKLEISKYKTT